MQWKRYALFLVSFLPTVQLMLHADPVNPSGQWAIIFLLLTTSITVLQKLFKTPAVKFRRQLGLWAGWYTGMHLWFYLSEGGISKFLSEWTYDYQLIGVVAVVGLVMLTLTSTTWAQKKLRANWAKLHELMYVIIGLGLVHGTIATKLGLWTMWPFFLVAALIFFRKKWKAQMLVAAGIALAGILTLYPEPGAAPAPQAPSPFEVPVEEPVVLDFEGNEIVSQSCVNGKELTYFADGRRVYEHECSEDPAAYNVDVWDNFKISTVTDGRYDG